MMLFKVPFVLLFLNLFLIGFSQENPGYSDPDENLTDSLKKNNANEKTIDKPAVNLNYELALRFLQSRMDSKYWINPEDPLKKSLDRLIFEASHDRFQIIHDFLKDYPYDSLAVPVEYPKPVEDSIDVLHTGDTFPEDYTSDNAASDISVRNDSISAISVPILESDVRDSVLIVLTDTVQTTNPISDDFPLRSINDRFQSDSIRAAVKVLLDYVDSRDSMMIIFTGIGQSSTPVWLNAKQGESMKRYWLKNEFSDSVTVWIGNEGRNTLGLYLEQGVNFRKPPRQEYISEARIDFERVDRSRLEKHNIVIKKSAWDYRTESSVVFSQSALSNWVKGGENSISTALDVTGYLDYKRPELKLSSSNFARIKLGFLASGDESVRKNLDLLETNSKLNHKAFGKFDFSAIMLFKTQVAAGKQYSKVKDPLSGEYEETSTVVSRFMNPATLTLGIGLDYKPNKETSVNFSPLSYKGTFVPGGGKITADSLLPGKIDQTRYGIAPGKRSKNEPGASFMFSKVSRPVKNLTLTNRLQLFTNYINNPQNIDVDWEMIAVLNLNWFTDLRLNTHLIFDDDTKTAVLKDEKPVYLEDGITEKKTARVQFKEMFGVSLVFRF